MTLFEILAKYHGAFLSGLLTTLKLAFLVWSSGLMLGTLIGVTGARWRSSVGLVSRVFSFFLAGIPVLVLLFWFHYPAQQMLGVVVDPFITATVTLSVINTFVVADIVRESVIALPRQYVDAAVVYGIDRRLAVRKIVLPMIIRHIMPPLLVTQVTMLHMTLFASLISVEEIFRTAQRINAITYRPVEIYSLLAFLFLVLSLPLNGLALVFRRRFGREWSER
jgi:polar amino acid transport system permease protein